MRKIIKRWIVNLIRDTYPKKDTDVEAVTKIAKEAVDEVVKQYSPCLCVNCSKEILAHYGGFYRNSEGKVFCSSLCIDRFKAK